MMRSRVVRVGLVAVSLVASFGLICCASSEEPQVPSLDESTKVTWGEQVFGSDKFDDLDAVVDSTVEANDTEKSKAWERGKYLVTSVAACGACHGAEVNDPKSALSGGLKIQGSAGEVVASNITPHPETGIGGWSVLEIVRALRDGLGREGKPLSLEQHAGYRWMADQDARAIAIYLQSLAPVEHKVPESSGGVLDFADIGLTASARRVKGYVPQPAQAQNSGYGMYLARFVAGCDRCHRSEGGWFGDGVPFAGFEAEEDDSDMTLAGPDIRGGEEHRLANWSNDQIVAYLKTGASPANSARAGAGCPWPYYAGMKERDLRAIALYLKQL
jgi:mono/diheme cytochrome c family protein